MNNNGIFRKSIVSDITPIMSIIAEAQAQLKNRGIDQWQNGYPNAQTISEDIKSNTSYVLDLDGSIIGTACISFDGEPTYNVIHDGAWLSEYEYAVIHRIAVANNVKGEGIGSILIDNAINLCISKGINSIKLDTHEKNASMQSLLRKNGFVLCGTIYLADGNNRLAFEKLL